MKAIKIIVMEMMNNTTKIITNKGIMFEHLGFILEGQDYLLHLPSPKELKTRNVFIYCQAEFSIRIRKFKYDKKK